MDKEPTNNSEKSSSKKYWLRALIIITIGIPVLIELMTLFNLVTVRFWDSEEADGDTDTAVTKTREFMQGDTLYSESPFVLTLQDVRVQVSPTEWRFLLSLATDSVSASAYQIQIDSLGLGTSQVLARKASLTWERAPDSLKWHASASWEIPNGDIPNRIFMTLRETVAEDSVVDTSKTIRLGPVPTRYYNQ